MAIPKILAGVVVLLLCAGYAQAGTDKQTKFTNIGSISNTRHNLTQRPIGGGSVFMDGSRNDYGEVCVYCHTPHAAATGVNLPLWNRTINAATNYITYDQLGTSSLTQTVSQPGINSLSCLSCHDGQTAVDSIINMPGSGRYSAAQETAQNDAFLDTWPGGGNGEGAPTSHAGLDSGGMAACLSCHVNPGGLPNATNFSVFLIGTDLTNDHPVGITFPSDNGPGTDFNTPTGVKGTAKYFDINSDGVMDPGDVRIYDTGSGAKVECASCHDPHGVPSAGPGSAFKPTFLRVANAGSALCMTCHVK